MVETAVATKKATAKTAKSEYVLMQFDPSVPRFGMGAYSEVGFKAFDMESGDTLFLAPGIQKVARSVYEQWRANPAPEVKDAFRREVLRLVSDETGINDLVDGNDTYEALQIVQNTRQISLLKEWMKGWEDMHPVILEAMKLKQDAIEADDQQVQTVKSVFGQNVPV